MNSLTDWMRQRDGIAHSSAVRDAGYSAHTVRRAIEAGWLTRVRRSWLVDEQCDPSRLSAAKTGGRITCLTAAAARGLWVPHSDDVHVAVASHASRIDSRGLTLHWAQGPIAVPTRCAEEPLINVLFQTARCLVPRDALAVWESALRTGQVAASVLTRIRWGSTAATRIAAIAGSLSDSGLETQFVDVMRMIGVVVRQQVVIDGHPVDGLIGERLIIQLDGFAHHQAAERRRDIRADARLALRGYTVLRFDYQQILFDPEYVKQTVLTAIAQGLHRARR